MSMSETAMPAVAEGRRAPSFGILRRVRLPWPGIAFCLLAAAVWEAMARGWKSPLMPDLAEVGSEILRLLSTGAAFEHVGVTLWRIALGGGAGFVLALLLGLLTARSRFLAAFLRPAVLLGLTVPGLVWALLCVIWFGVGLATPVASIILGITPPLLVSIAEGLRAVDPELREMAHVFRFPRRFVWRHVLLPSIMPFLVSSVRLGFSLAWKVIVLVELFGMSNGVGYQLNSEFSSQNVAGVLAWTVIFWVVMSAIEVGLIQALENRLMRWRREARV